jgi:hypothetical protein
MPKMLSAHSTISQWNPRSAIAELPRASRKARIAEPSREAASAGRCSSWGAGLGQKLRLGDANLGHLGYHLIRLPGQDE